MRIGVPSEFKADEYRVAMTPAGVRELVARGHDVIVQRGAGDGAGISDAAYAAQGATIVADEGAVFLDGDLIVKVREPQPVEVAMLAPHHTLLSFMPPAALCTLRDGLVASGATWLAYERVTDASGGHPLRAPMRTIAGAMAAQVGASLLSRPGRGGGVLAGGAVGVPASKAMVIGAGDVGIAAARGLVGAGTETYVYDRSPARLEELARELDGHGHTVFATAVATEAMLPAADLVVGAVPHALRRDHLGLLRRGTVLVDACVERGGAFATSRPTTLEAPVIEVDGIVHHCLPDLAGLVPVTATAVLANAVLPYVLAIAADGVSSALAADAGLRSGLVAVCVARP